MSNVIDKLLVFNIGVNDIDKSKDFYVDRLGLKVVTDIGQGRCIGSPSSSRAAGRRLPLLPPLEV